MQKKAYNRSNLRAWLFLVFFFTTCFAIIIFRLFQIQVVSGEKYKSMALQQQNSSTLLSAKRGSIFDRNEKVLAQSAVVWNVCISPAEIKDEQWSQIAKKMSEILDMPEEDVLKHKGKQSYYALVKTAIDNKTREKLEAYIETGGEDGKRLRTIYFEEAPKRFYTYDSLASNLIGFANNDHHGAYGLEAYYDSILAGTPGVDVASGDGIGGQETQSYKPEDGHSLVLTIDESVQASLEKHLEMAIVEHGVSNGATSIFMNIKTGEILGTASKPDFNANEPYVLTDSKAIAELEALDAGPDSEEYKTLQQNLLYNQWRNKAISDPYEPGSVYKIVTASISLEEQKTFWNDQFNCTGSIEVADRTMNCWWLPGHGLQDLSEIMENSCNPAFVTLGLRNGMETTRNYMHDFGFGKITGIDLPAEAEGILHSSTTNIVQLASVSFGQSFKATPIQIITATSAAVNGGYLVQPYVVQKILDSQGNVVETIEPTVKRQVISESTSNTVKKLVEAVVADGSGRYAAVPGYRIGGKTGTSEKLDLLPRKEYVLSFVGFAPMEDPTYACLVVLDEPSLSDPWASVIAAPIVGAIFQENLPYLGVEPHFTAEELAQKPVDVPYLIAKKPHDAQAELTKLGIKTRMLGQGSSVVRQIPLAGESIIKGNTVTLFCSEEELNTNIKMPDLTGLNKEDAKKILHDLELNVVFEGDAKSASLVVSSQWPLADEKLTSGDVVKVILKVDKGVQAESLPELPIMPPEEIYTIDETPETSIEDEGITIVVPEELEPKPEPEPEPEPRVESSEEEKKPNIGPSGEIIDG